MGTERRGAKGRKLSPRADRAALIVASAAGIAAIAALARDRSPATTPLIFALVVFAAAIVLVGTRKTVRYVPTPTVILAGVGAVLSIPVLRSLGVASGATDLVAVVGAVAALITLALVQRQIEIAREQVGLALREIDLVEKDLAYSKEQSAFAHAQVAELTRRPRLAVAFADGGQYKELPGVRARYMFSADLLVLNNGDRTARDAYIEALIPWSALQHDFSDEQVMRHADTELVDGIPHRRFGKQIVEPIYRDLGRAVDVFSEPLVMDPESFTLRWRLRDDYGAYPQDGQWGQLEVRVPPKTAAMRLRYMARRPDDLHPMLAWDRSGTDRFVYASLAPDPSDEVAIIDERLQQRIVDLVWSTPGLGGTTPVTGEIGVEFTLGERHGPLSAATTNETAEAQVYERSRHRCFVRADGAVEVRLPQDDSEPTYQILRALGAMYMLALALHRELGTQPRAKGRFVYKLGGLIEPSIGGETDRWIDMRLSGDEFAEYVTPIVMVLQRAGKTPPVESETRQMVETFWRPYASRLGFP